MGVHVLVHHCKMQFYQVFIKTCWKNLTVSQNLTAKYSMTVWYSVEFSRSLYYEIYVYDYLWNIVNNKALDLTRYHMWSRYIKFRRFRGKPLVYEINPQNLEDLSYPLALVALASTFLHSFYKATNWLACYGFVEVSHSVTQVPVSYLC